jgi:hypothetical protein
MFHFSSEMALKVEQRETMRTQSGSMYEETKSEMSSTGTRMVSFWLGFVFD